MAGRAPTLVDVASHAGVSPMTVSRVLAGGANVRPALRARVLQSVEDLGYRRNENARTLRQGKGTGLIGVAITNIDNPYYAELVLGIEEVAHQSNLRLLLGTTRESSDREAQLLDDFIGRQVDGLIVVPAGGVPHLERTQVLGTPLVFASRTVESLAMDAVLVDDTAGAREAAADLISQGRRRIAFLGNAETVSTSRRRLEGYRQAHAEAGLEPDPDLVVLGAQSTDDAEASAEKLLARPDPPDAFFATNNRTSLGVLRALAARHRAGRLQAAPVLAFFDQFDLAGFVPWPMVLVVHDAREVGRLSARLLIEHLDQRAQWTPRTLQVPTALQHLP